MIRLGAALDKSDNATNREDPGALKDATRDVGVRAKDLFDLTELAAKESSDPLEAQRLMDALNEIEDSINRELGQAKRTIDDPKNPQKKKA